MPNYPTHSRWGRIGAAVMAIAVGSAIVVLFEAPFIAVAAAVGAAAATFVGAIFPDIDHHKSIPRRKANQALRILVVLGIAALVGLTFEQLVATADSLATEFVEGELPVPPEVVVAVGAVVVAGVLAWAVDPAIGLTTQQHRGWTHNVPVTFVLTAALAGVVWFFTRELLFHRQVAAIAVIGTFYVGILIHLGLDGEIV